MGNPLKDKFFWDIFGIIFAILIKEYSNTEISLTINIVPIVDIIVAIK